MILEFPPLFSIIAGTDKQIFFRQFKEEFQTLSNIQSPFNQFGFDRFKHRGSDKKLINGIRQGVENFF